MSELSIVFFLNKHFFNGLKLRFRLHQSGYVWNCIYTLLPWFVNLFWQGFQQDAFSDSRFTGFLWTNGRFVAKSAVSKISRFVWTGPKPEVCCWCRSQIDIILNPYCSFVMIVTVISVQFVSNYWGHCLQVSFFTWTATTNNAFEICRGLSYCFAPNMKLGDNTRNNERLS